MIMARMRDAVGDYLRREHGSSSEYALLLAIASVAVGGAVLALGVHIGNAALDSANCFSNAPDCAIAVTIKGK